MKIKNLPLLLFALLFASTVSAQKYLSTDRAVVTKEWNGNNFTSTKTISENIENAPQFTVLKKIINDDGLKNVLESGKMVTVFAITDNSFSKLTKEKKDSILGNKKLVNAMVKHLVVPGRLDSYSLKAAVEKQGGLAHLTTLQGDKLDIKEKDHQLILMDSEGNTAAVVAADFYHKNGFFHIVDGLVFPPSKK
jgi:uncharacterized surface protein with fasciclin (FAS1) repeats